MLVMHIKNHPDQTKTDMFMYTNVQVWGLKPRPLVIVGCALSQPID